MKQRLGRGSDGLGGDGLGRTRQGMEIFQNAYRVFWKKRLGSARHGEARRGTSCMGLVRQGDPVEIPGFLLRKKNIDKSDVYVLQRS